MTYTQQTLIFEQDRIYFLNPYEKEEEVMMDWEDDLMSASAAYVTQNGGDILEIGFGMGISANYIQSHVINSHTIVENHPAIIPKALELASDKPNVTIVEGNWFDVKDSLSTYDGLFYDTYGDECLQYFPSSLTQLMNHNGVATWWNALPTPSNVFGIDGVEYQEFSINPPKNTYFNHTKYYLPKKQF